MSAFSHLTDDEIMSRCRVVARRTYGEAARHRYVRSALVEFLGFSAFVATMYGIWVMGAAMSAGGAAC